MTNATVTNAAIGTAVVDNVEVVVAENNVVEVNGITAHLEPLEHKFLEFIAAAHGQVRTTRALFRHLFDDGKPPYKSILNVTVCMLRKGLTIGNQFPDASRTVRTVHGRGFAFGLPSAAPIPAEGVSLPESGERWVPYRKEYVLNLIQREHITEEEVLRHYTDLSRTELMEWQILYEKYGQAGLRTSLVEQYPIEMSPEADSVDIQLR